VTARQILLDGLARDADIFELVSELAPLHPRDNTFPGEVFLHVAADTLDWCGASRAEGLSRLASGGRPPVCWGWSYDENQAKVNGHPL